jgi:hypothetical protein
MWPWIAVEGFDQVAPGVGDIVFHKCPDAILGLSRPHAAMTDRAAFNPIRM